MGTPRHSVGVFGDDADRMTLRQLQWAADGRLRAEWDQTALIVAKIHNAHYTKPVQPWEIGPYAVDPEERKLALGDVAGLLKGLPGVKLEEIPEPGGRRMSPVEMDVLDNTGKVGLLLDGSTDCRDDGHDNHNQTRS